MIWPIVGTLKDTTTLGLSGPGSNGNQKFFTFPRSPKLKPHYQMLFNVISRTPLFSGWRVKPHCRRYSQCSKPYQLDNQLCSCLQAKTSVGVSLIPKILTLFQVLLKLHQSGLVEVVQHPCETGTKDWGF